MAINVTAKTRSLLNQIQKNPSIVIDIEGIDLIISSSAVFKKVKWDDGITWDQDGIRWDSSIPNGDAKSFINLRESTNAITQQIYPDKEGSSSITSMLISIVDKNKQIARATALNTVSEILGKKVVVKFGFVGGTYPDDFLDIMNGIITDYSYMSGAVKIQISSSEALKRQTLLTQYNSQLTASIDASQTTVAVGSTEKLLPSVDCMTTYIKIDDEIMEVSSVDSATQLTVVRSELNTVGASHDNEAEIVSTYRLQELPLTLAQKIMQSDEDNSFFDSDITLKNFNYIDATTTIQNAILFDDYNVEKSTGLVAGDIISVENYSQYTAQSFGVLDSGDSYIVVEETLPTVVDVGESWRFKSQYNVLNFGLGMFPFEVDNAEFEFIKTTFQPNFVQMDFKLEDEIDGREFISKELMFACGCYGIPRNARSSVKFLSPPLTIEDLPVLNETNITNTSKLNPTRSVNKFFYNSVLFKFNKSVQDGEFKSFTEFINQDAVNLVGVGKKQLKIESAGYIRSTATDLVIENLSGRYLDRYKGAATFIKGVTLPLKSGIQLQVGDVVLFGGEGTKVLDFETGDRDLAVAKYEIINQSVDLKGEIKIDILSTNFSIAGVFGVFSPSSLVGAGSTTTSINLKRINTSEDFIIERDKWNNLVGAELRIRSNDYAFDETVTLQALDAQNNNTITISALSVTPTEDYIVELAEYGDHPIYGLGGVTDILKIKYTFTMPQTTISSVTDTQSFDVDDVSILFEGQLIAVHSDDFTRDAFEVTIDSIAGSTVTLTEALSFTPQVGDFVETRSLEDLDGYLFL